MRARPYDAPRDRRAWDELVRGSRTPSVLLQRGFMEYHADRFEDASLVVVDGVGAGEEVVGVLPASRHDDLVRSHGGLTYGGLVTRPGAGAREVLDMLGAVATCLLEQGAATLDYRAMPHVYHLQPAEEDLYALHRLGASLAGRAITQSIRLAERPRPRKGRRASVARAARTLEVAVTRDWGSVVTLLEQVLRRHGARPVHDAAELELLAGRFPDAIRALAAVPSGGDGIEAPLAVAVTFDSPACCHVQYLGAAPEGREVGALDLVVDAAIERAAREGRTWFDFGISTEADGRVLNDGLASWKEGFGARGVACDRYELDLSGAVKAHPGAARAAAAPRGGGRRGR